MHGRIGNPGSIQVDVGDGGESAHPYVEHFKQLWRAAMRGCREAQESNVMLFLAALEKCLSDQGHKFPRGASVAAAAQSDAQ